MRKQFILLVVMVLFFACFGFADLIYLKNGKTIEGQVISRKEDKVTIQLSLGKQGDMVYTLETSRIDKIEEAPVSYDFLAEEDAPAGIESVGRKKKILENIIKKVLVFLGWEKGKFRGVNLDRTWKRIRADIASSGLMGFIANFFLILLGISTFNVFRKDSGIIAGHMGKLTGARILGRWLFFSVGLVFVQLQRFGSFDFIGSGLVSIFVLAVICYETLGLLVLLFFRKQYKAFISGGKVFNIMVFKVPIACEFSLFAYLFLMDIFIIML